MKVKQNMDIEKVVKNVTVTLAIEELKPSKEVVTINWQFLEEKISSEEAVNRIKAKYVKAIVN